MDANLHIDASVSEMVGYGMPAAMALSSPGDPHAAGFLHQLHDAQGFPVEAPGMMDPMAVMDPNGDPNAKNRHRGNYRCSKCGEPKKGHVCPLVPANFKCSRCGLSKKSCTCEAPTTRSIGIQVEMDEDMTTRAIDLSVQGYLELQPPSPGYPSPPVSAHASPSSLVSPPHVRF